VEFSPVTDEQSSDTFDVPSDDPLRPTVTVTLTSTAAIPTLGQTGMLLLCLLLLVSGLAVLRRRVET
jgi:hypothetical protein